MNSNISRQTVRTGDRATHKEASKSGVQRTERSRTSSWLRTAFFVCLLVGLLVAQPAAAQEANPICQDESGTLVEMIEGFVQITTGLGVMGLLVVWQAESLMEMFTFDQTQKTNFKRHKQSALKSASILVLLGPLFTLAGSAMSLPIAECVTLMPF